MREKERETLKVDWNSNLYSPHHTLKSFSGVDLFVSFYHIRISVSKSLSERFKSQVPPEHVLSMLSFSVY
jgi:hypothetical protein